MVVRRQNNRLKNFLPTSSFRGQAQQMTVTPLFKKLNFKQHKEILIVNHPTEFEAELNAIKDYIAVKTDIKSIAEIEFVLIGGR